MCVVPTLTLDLLFAVLVLGHGRRQLLWFQVTRNPTAEWLARQITEAFPWTSALAYLVRDNDRAYGHVFTSRVKAMGYPRSTDLSWITVAEWLCRTSDRHIALRVPGSSAHLRRGAPAANSLRLFGVLQSSAHALGITERCALTSSRPTIWRYRRHSDPGWTASPIRPDMIFGKETRPWRPESSLRSHLIYDSDTDPLDRPAAAATAAAAGGAAAASAANDERAFREALALEPRLDASLLPSLGLQISDDVGALCGIRNALAIFITPSWLHICA
jgi:hypothetical protein